MSFESEQNKEINEGPGSNSSSRPIVAIEDMKAHAEIASKYNSAVQDGILSNLSIDLNRNQPDRMPERMPGYPGDMHPPYGDKPREISDKDYKDLANDIIQNGKIPDRLKDALDRKNGNQIIDLDKLNELIKPLRLDIDRLPDGRRRLDLRDPNGNIIDSAKSRSGSEQDHPNILPPRQWWERYVPQPVDRLLPERKPN